MISDGSCDTEDWKYDAENPALITGTNDLLKYIQTEKQLFKIVIFEKYYCGLQIKITCSAFHSAHRFKAALQKVIVMSVVP